MALHNGMVLFYDLNEPTKLKLKFNLQNVSSSSFEIKRMNYVEPIKSNRSIKENNHNQELTTRERLELMKHYSDTRRKKILQKALIPKKSNIHTP